MDKEKVNAEISAKETEETAEEKKQETPDFIPYIIYEGEMARQERMIERLGHIILTEAIVTIIIITALIVAFFMYESFFDTLTYQQDGEGINNINMGEQGDLYGTESPYTEEESGKS